MDEQLIAAIVAKNLQQVEELLAAGANPNTQQEGKTAYQWVPYGVDEIKCALIVAGAEDPELHHALVWVIKTGRVDAVQTLINGGADINVSTYSGTPIYVAANGGHVEIVDLLIAAGADLNAGGMFGTPLLAAIEKGHTEVALTLIAAGADPHYTTPYAKVPPIAMAAAQGSVSVLQALITAGADINVAVPHITLNRHVIQQQTVDPPESEVAIDSFPVIIAAWCGHAEALAVLLEAGAITDSKDGEGLSAYDWAVRNKYPKVLDVLRHFGIDSTYVSPNEALLLAAETGDLVVLTAAWQAGADINTRDARHRSKDKTPLMLAAHAGHLAIVQALLGAGADPNLTDRKADDQSDFRSLLEHTDPETVLSLGYRFGRTALMAAAAAGKTEVVQALLAAGANPNPQDVVDYTALALAIENRHLAVVQALAAAGVDVNQTVTYGNTPLLLACREGAIDIATVLVHHGANAHVSNRERETPLIKSAAAGSLPLVRLCLEQGVDVNVIAIGRKTAITYAVGASRYVQVERDTPSSGIREYRDDGSCWDWQSFPEAEIIELVQALLAAGADPNMADCDTTPLIEAARNGQLQLLQILLAAGARLELKDRDGYTAAAMAKLYSQQPIREFLRGYTGTNLREFDRVKQKKTKARERWGEEVPRPDFAAAAQAPDYQQAVQDLAAHCGSRPTAWDEVPGWFSIHVESKRRPEIDTAALQCQFLERGCFVYEPKHFFGDGPERLCILPTTDKYDVIALHQTNGCNSGIGPGYVIEWLRQLEAEQPFILTCIAHDTLAGRFLTPVADPNTWAERMYDFCSDIVSQGCGSVELLAENLANRDKLFFWWD
jgi:ankyrin repeat protein